MIAVFAVLVVCATYLGGFKVLWFAAACGIVQWFNRGKARTD